jgi:hypothetical protein
MKHLVAWLMLAAAGWAQGRVLGEAVGPASSEGILLVKDQAGSQWAVRLEEAGEIVMVAPGAKDLSGATPYALAQIKAGDRLLVRGVLDTSAKLVLASSVVVMSKDAVEAAKAKEQSEWRTRGLAGAVESVDAAAGKLQLKAAGNGGRIWTVNVSPAAKLLRYSDESVRFADATPAALADVRVSDQMRVVGEKNEAAGEVVAEKIVFGSFRTLGGEITSVNAARSEITIKDVQTKKPVALKLTAASNLRKMPQFGNGGPGMTGPPRAGFAPQAGPTPGPRRPDLQQMLDRMPAGSINALKPGDAVIVSAGRTAGPQPWAVVSLVSGVDMLLRAPAAQVNQTLGNWNTELPVQ